MYMCSWIISPQFCHSVDDIKRAFFRNKLARKENTEAVFRNSPRAPQLCAARPQFISLVLKPLVVHAVVSWMELLRLYPKVFVKAPIGLADVEKLRDFGEQPAEGEMFDRLFPHRYSCEVVALSPQPHRNSDGVGLPNCLPISRDLPALNPKRLHSFPSDESAERLSQPRP